MAEENKNLTEKSEGVKEEKTQVTEIKVDMSGVLTTIDEIKKSDIELKETLKQILEIVRQPPVKLETEKKDETKGIVKEMKKEEVKTDESLVLEKAETGKGFQMWRDYTKENSGKFKRLIRG